VYLKTVVSEAQYSTQASNRSSPKFIRTGQTKFYCNKTLKTSVTQFGEAFLTRSTQKIEAFFQILEIQETKRKKGNFGENSKPMALK
jgi:hypothetical protein